MASHCEVVLAGPEQARVTIVRDGFSREILFRRDQPSILDCASAAGLGAPPRTA